MLALGSIARASMGGFSVTPVFPENQSDGVTSFFDLWVTAGQQEVIYIRVSNLTDSEIFVDAALITATTSREGTIDYSSARGFIEGKPNALTNIASVQEGYIFIPARGDIDIPIVIDIPADGFDGIILGAVEVMLGVTEEERAAGGMLMNRFAQAIPIVLREHGAAIPVAFEIGEISAGLFNGMATVTVEILHEQPRLTMATRINARIYPEGSSTPIFNFQNINADFAPNSVFAFPFVDLAGHGIEYGDYNVVMQITHNDVTWDFEYDFTIAPLHAAAINDDAVNIQQQLPVQAQAPYVNVVIDDSGSDFPVVIIAVAVCVAVAACVGAVVLNIKAKNAKQIGEKALRDLERMKRLDELKKDL